MAPEKAEKGIHTLVKVHYIPRIIGYILILIMLFFMYKDTANILLWVIIITNTLIWPHVAYLYGRKSKNPRRAEYQNMYFEAITVGLWILFIKCSLWPSTALFLSCTTNILSTGGPRYFVKSLGFFAIGFIGGVLLFGFEFVPDINFYTALTSILFLAGYTSLTSFWNYQFSMNVTRGKKKLEKANDDLIQARDMLWSEMELAKKIQTILLPTKPEMDGYEIAAYMKPADEVGGDYYDVINVGGRNWIIIGDVSGHGVPAGLIMMMVQTAIHNSLEFSPRVSPAHLLGRINKTIANNIKLMNEDKYMTITVFAAMEDDRIIHSGLHQDILIYRRESNSIEAIETDGMWIGLFADIDTMLEDRSFQLNNGDCMLLYTDGITESWKSDPRIESDERSDKNMFGVEKLGSILLENGQKNPEELKQIILAEMKDYESDDDVTMIIIKRVN